MLKAECRNQKTNKVFQPSAFCLLPSASSTSFTKIRDLQWRVLELSPTPTTPRSTPSAPIAPEERSLTLDILRGFCLLGILLINIETFAGLWFQPPEFALTETGSSVRHWIETFVSSSFRPSLSLLFGLGFALQLRRNPNAVGRFSRRLLVLLAFGLIHGFVIWYGDILTEYALVGFLLIPFAKRSNATVLLWSVLVFFLLIFTIPITAALHLPLDRTAIAYSFMYGSPLETLRTNAHIYSDALVTAIQYISQTISCFLLGLWLGRVGALERPQKHRIFLLGALAVALLLAWWGYRQNMNNYRFLFDVLFASPVLGFAYIFAFALLLSFTVFQEIFYFFAYIGRMALTTYITDSVVLSLLFYGYGLGWYAQFYSGEWIYVALGLFGVQVVFSWLWLKFFRLGPLEWLWRSLTYGKVQLLRKGTALAYSSFGLEKPVEPSIPSATTTEQTNNPVTEEFAETDSDGKDSLEKPATTPEVAWQKELEELSTPSLDNSHTLEETEKITNPVEEKIKDSRG